MSKLAKRIEAARRILSLYDSPFPDSIERRSRSKQEELVRHLEEQLRKASGSGAEKWKKSIEQ